MNTSTRLNRISDQVANLLINTRFSDDLSFDAVLGFNARREVSEFTAVNSTEQNLLNH